MNTPNPLIPQGALPSSQGRSHIRIAVFSILAVHVVLLGALLLQGCKRTTEQTATLEPTTESAYPAWEEPTNPTPLEPFPDYSTPVPPPVDTGSEVVVVPPPPGGQQRLSIPGTVEPFPPTGRERQLEPMGLGRGNSMGVTKTHVVVKGESFYTVGKLYGVSSRAVAQANPGVEATRLKIGQKLNIPPPAAPEPQLAASSGASGAGVYVVKSGDNLSKIAKDNCTTVRKLRSENGLTTDRIKVGQKLRLPGQSDGAESKVLR